MDHLMLIGQFAEVAGISRRMLRHYEKIGLIAPTVIDDENGYRHYTLEQLPTLKTITTLQGYGFSLTEIRQMQTSPLTVGEFLNELKEKELLIRNRMDADAGHLIRIKRTIGQLQSDTAPGPSDRIQLNQLPLERSRNMTDYSAITQQAKEMVASLPNTLYFSEQVDQHVKKSPDIQKAYITFDLDHFMGVNEKYGYEVGDAVIYNSFQVLLDSFKPMFNMHKSLVTRAGGDELVIYVEGFETDIIISTVEDALENIRNFDYSPYGCLEKMTSSCGVYLFKNYEHSQEPRHESGIAFMEVKRQGGDQYLVYNQS